VRTLRATGSPENHASLALLRRAGFLHVGEQQDPEDGLELIYQLAADHYFG
jgi:RimJ/RimL family protein N-acetyltransferase